ncbi:MAG: DUF488 domain-containing protein, partial [Candidatus Hydrothermarchaeota archaeon]|nr:DUF488 domain-containing protein [Candidatus Hydrothermarchaeota archaeon]
YQNNSKDIGRFLIMVTIYTIGFTKKSLEEFVNLLRENNITKLIDIRLNRNSQLFGFAKERDIKYILEEFLNMKYEVISEFAPTEELRKEYQKDKDWEKYEKGFLKIIKERNLEKFKGKVLDDKERICLLCSEPEPDNCHRRLISEFFSKLGSNVNIKHL